MQYDFLPDGALAVADSDAIVAPISELMRSDRFDLIVATQDWHPAGHISFASVHRGRAPFETITLYGRPQVLWPDHCVAGTPGARLHDALPWDLADAFIRKGTDARVDSYSGFRNNRDESGRRPPTGLAGYLRDRGIDAVHVCGLARDYCVRWTAEDAAGIGFETHFLWDLTRPVDASEDDALRTALVAGGVRIRESTGAR
jgi:nicotinamidase/pyrazinamidase